MNEYVVVDESFCVLVQQFLVVWIIHVKDYAIQFQAFRVYSKPLLEGSFPFEMALF